MYLCTTMEKLAKESVSRKLIVWSDIKIHIYLSVMKVQVNKKQHIHLERPQIFIPCGVMKSQCIGQFSYV